MKQKISICPDGDTPVSQQSLLICGQRPPLHEEGHTMQRWMCLLPLVTPIAIFLELFSSFILIRLKHLTNQFLPSTQTRL